MLDLQAGLILSEASLPGLQISDLTSYCISCGLPCECVCVVVGGGGEVCVCVYACAHMHAKKEIW